MQEKNNSKVMESANRFCYKKLVIVFTANPFPHHIEWLCHVASCGTKWHLICFTSGRPWSFAWNVSYYTVEIDFSWYHNIIMGWYGTKKNIFPTFCATFIIDLFSYWSCYHIGIGPEAILLLVSSILLDLWLGSTPINRSII